MNGKRLWRHQYKPMTVTTAAPVTPTPGMTRAKAFGVTICSALAMISAGFIANSKADACDWCVVTPQSTMSSPNNYRSPYLTRPNYSGQIKDAAMQRSINNVLPSPYYYGR